jgi:hypothetical protein
VWGLRFWALAEESSIEEEVEEPRGGEKEVSLSPRSGPSSVTFEDFLSPPWQQVDGSRASAAGRRQQKFAPGGKGSLVRRTPAARASRSRSPMAARARFGEPEEFPPLHAGVSRADDVKGLVQASPPVSLRQPPVQERVALAAGVAIDA